MWPTTMATMQGHFYDSRNLSELQAIVEARKQEIERVWNEFFG
jgi:hypothetical protein